MAEATDFHRIRFGPGPGLELRTLRETPYLELRDTNGVSILTLAVTPAGYTVHLANGVYGAPLADA